MLIKIQSYNDSECYILKEAISRVEVRHCLDGQMAYVDIYYCGDGRLRFSGEEASKFMELFLSGQEVIQ